MSRTPDRLPTRAAAVLLLGTAVVFACGDPRTPVDPDDGISAAAHGGQSAVAVTAASPNHGGQGQVNELVTITGSGFKTGAKASWERNGAADPKITVVSTQFISPTQLVATITIASDAVLDLYDVAVTNADRTKGIGNLLFQVTLGDPTASFSIPLADGALALRSDHLYGNGTSSVYAHGVCGVSGSIFATDAGSNSGDARVQTDLAGVGKTKKCADYPRHIYVDFGDGIEAETSMNARALETTTYAIPVGSSVRRKFLLGISARCGNVVFGETQEGLLGDSVIVTRMSSSEWHVQTQPFPNDRAICRGTGVLYHMPIDVTIYSSRPLP